MQLLAPAQEMRVMTEYDVVVLRQSLRQITRDASLSLVKQASFTAAVSEIARDLLDKQWIMLFTILVHQIDQRRAIEVKCHRPKDLIVPSLHEFQSKIAIQAARQLLDETSFDALNDRPGLILRMWV